MFFLLRGARPAPQLLLRSGKMSGTAKINSPLSIIGEKTRGTDSSEAKFADRGLRSCLLF
jgi:hypothetical protein